MKLAELLSIMDSTTRVKIWEGDYPEIAFDGCVFEVPWTLVNHEIGRVEDDEEPIFLVIEKNEFNVDLPIMVINIL